MITYDFAPQQYGAVADGVTDDTAAIQAAIEAAHQAGGGTVYFAAGKYRSGSIRLRSHVDLYVGKGAIILGMVDKDAYHRLSEDAAASSSWGLHDYDWFSLILADSVEDVAIYGPGAIDGQGKEFSLKYDPNYPSEHGKMSERYRPLLIFFARSTNIRIEGVHLRNPGGWMQCYLQCDDVRIDGIDVESISAWNNDGIDIVDSRNVIIRGCKINAADDGICLKSTEKVVENVVVSDCIVRTSASAFKCGTGSGQGFRNIVVNNLAVYDNGRSGIALEVVDGGTMEQVSISNVTMRNVGNAIFMRLGDRHRMNSGHKNPGALRNVTISNISAHVTGLDADAAYPFRAPRKSPRTNPLPSIIVGIAGSLIEDVVLSDISIVYVGDLVNETTILPENVPECESAYPEYDQFGELPAWGLYLRHINGIALRDVTLKLRGRDTRPAIVRNDVHRLRSEGVEHHIVF